MVVVTWMLSTSMSLVGGAGGGEELCGDAAGGCWERSALEQSKSRARLGSGFFMSPIRRAGMYLSSAFRGSPGGVILSCYK
jgi:hypothetical protein